MDNAIQIDKEKITELLQGIQNALKIGHDIKCLYSPEDPRTQLNGLRINRAAEINQYPDSYKLRVGGYLHVHGAAGNGSVKHRRVNVPLYIGVTVIDLPSNQVF